MLQRCLSFSQFCDIRPSPLTHKPGFCTFTSVHCNQFHSKDPSVAHKPKHIGFPRQLPIFTEVLNPPNTHTRFYNCWVMLLTIYFFQLKDWTFVLYNLLGKTKFSLSVFKNTEKFCSITRENFFSNSEVGNNDNNYTFYFAMLALCLTVFFQ